VVNRKDGGMTMEPKQAAAQALGAIGGRSRSADKVAAARTNAAKARRALAAKRQADAARVAALTGDPS